MEPDRYEQNHTFYIIGLICLIVSMTLFGTGAYLLPRTVFGLNYNIPDFIFQWTALIQVAYGMSDKSAGWLVLFIFFLLGFLFSSVTYVVSNRIDSEIYAIKPEKKSGKKLNMEIKETGPLVLKVLLIIIFVFIVAKVSHWAISIH